MTLIDGYSYWLGAVWGIYRADGDYFDIGNTWVNRGNTVYGRESPSREAEIDYYLDSYPPRPSDTE